MNFKQQELLEEITAGVKKIHPEFKVKVFRESGTTVDMDVFMPSNEDQAIAVQEYLAQALEQILVDYGYFFSCFPVYLS